ncbi:glucosamine 6-phosphate N-acetyltransferase [Acaromyces ingoldii]|uniref:Glucosamine 6-phosphate N-acetyltransferase n=1 Tax=Acaromyces ingoldii TaxID=215250 RepID=A0A316YSU0_9BASI|nr:glucosamine 6-phosphate N-acetyltransferase [Acaromyces ingoldii]PWN92477.1 glucosamine 6-phosphate N-acetyltransferase [Acaromyces ingoldii]
MSKLTPDSELELLFDAKLIPDEVKNVGDGLHLRPLSSTDYDRGHLRVLEALTKVPDPGRDAWLRQFQLMQQSKPAAYYTLAILDAATDEIVAVGSLFIEYKFIRGLGACGHIEDIAVDPKTQGKGLGKKLIRALTGLSEALGTYKVILDCSEDNKPFYEKCEYKLVGVQMAKYAAHVQK